LLVFHAVDVVEQQEVRIGIVEPSEDAALVVADRPLELLVGTQLVQRVRLERDVTEPLGVGAVGEPAVDELPEQGRLSDALPPDEPEHRLVLELTARVVRAGEVVVVAPGPRREGRRERRRTVRPPRVVPAEGVHQRVPSVVDAHRRVTPGGPAWTAGSRGRYGIGLRARPPNALRPRTTHITLSLSVLRRT